MTTKKDTLKQLKALLKSGEVTKEEVQKLIEADHGRELKRADDERGRRHLTATDSMFIIGGVILFAAFQVLIAQTLENISARITAESGMLGAGLALFVAVALWAAVLIGDKRGKTDRKKSGIVKGFTLSFLVAGSLLLVTSAVYVTMALTVSGDTYGIIPKDYYIFGMAILVVAGIHGLFARVTKHAIVAGAGVLAATAGVTSLLLGTVNEQTAPVDVYALIFIGTGVLLAAAARIVHRTAPKLLDAGIFDVLGQLIALTAMTVALSGERDILWRVALIAATLGLFYLSISKKSQSTLAVAAFFLIVTIVSTAFKYFSGMGTAFVLFISAIAVLGVATAAVVIRQKYMSNTTK